MIQFSICFLYTYKCPIPNVIGWTPIFTSAVPGGREFTV